MISGSLAIGVLGGAVLATASVGSIATAVTGFALLSFAIGLVTTLTTDHVIAAAPPERAGMASGITETAAELGIALGVALLGSVATAVQTRGSDEPLRRVAGDAVREAFTSGLQLSAALAATALLVLAVLALRYLRREVRTPARAEP